MKGYFMSRIETLETLLIQAICYDRNLEEVRRIADEAPELFTNERSLGMSWPVRRHLGVVLSSWNGYWIIFQD